MNLHTKLESKGPSFWLVAGSFFAVLVGTADFVTGREFTFSLFYLLPIVLVTWFSGRFFGIAMSIVVGIIWVSADTFSGPSYSHPLIAYWNAGVRLGILLLVSLLISALKTLEHEKEIARVDHLTGIANRRHFFEAAQAELDRSRRYRHPFTIVYIDLDGFKSVNDRFGHQQGDSLLCAIVTRMKNQLRRTDLLARLGGDEFVLLLPEIDEAAARAIAPKLQSNLLDEMRRNRWPVTFSIGALTYRGGEIGVDDLISKADELMYSVKKSGKNAIAYAAYSSE
jgi:diguanylate cyclase (GGDEF)-like protein